jgi:hypothetical protein
LAGKRRLKEKNRREYWPEILLYGTIVPELRFIIAYTTLNITGELTGAFTCTGYIISITILDTIKADVSLFL